MAHKAIPAEALVELRQRLAALPPRSAARRQLVHDTASLYGVSATTLYRALRDRARPRAVRRSDRGAPRILPADQMQRYCEIIAAIKLRTSNKQGRHLSTAEAIRLIETCGIDTPEGHIHAPPGVLTRPTVNRYLKQWGYDRTTLLRPPPAVRFQAEYSNDCWHFDCPCVRFKPPPSGGQISSPLCWTAYNSPPPTARGRSSGLSLRQSYGLQHRVSLCLGHEVPLQGAHRRCRTACAGAGPADV